MNIGLLIYGSLDTVSGGFLYDRKLVAHLRDVGHTVTLFSQPWQAYGRLLTHNFSPQMRQQLLDAPLDLLLQDELNHPSLAWLNGWLRPRVDYPIISIVHHLRSSERHPAVWRGLYRYVEQRYLRGVDGFVFNSQITRRAVEALAGTDKRPFIIATPAGNRPFPPLSQEQINQRASEPGPLRLLFVGNVQPRKGVHTLIEAVAQLAPTVWQLDVVGNTAVSPDYARHWLQTMPRRLGIDQNITVHGSLSDAALEALFMRSQLLCVPSGYEGFGIVYLEGMAAGLPAIGTTAGAAHEIITPHENGYLIDPNDGAGLAALLETLFEKRPLLAQLGWQARQTFTQFPTWSESMANIEQFLRRLVA